MIGRSRRSRRPRERGSYSGSAAFGIASVGVIALISLASSVITARLYGIEVIGAFALAYAPTGIANAFSTMQEQASLSKELAAIPPRAPRVTGMFFAVQLFSTGLTVLVALAVGAVTAALYAGPIDQPELIAPALALLVGYVVIDNTSWNLDVIFAAFRAGRDLFIVRMVTATVFVIAAVALSAWRDDVWALTFAQLIAITLGLFGRLLTVHAFMRFVVPVAELRRGLGDLRGIAAFGSRLAPAFAAEGVAHESGTWILGATSSVAAVGAWNRAWMLGRRLLDPGFRIGEVLFPTLVQQHGSGDHEAFDRTLVDTARYSAAGLLLPAAAAGGAAVGIMEIFGPGFDEAATALAILALVPVLYGVENTQLLAQTAVGRPWEASRISLVRAAVMIGAGAALSVPFGVTGMAAGYVLGYALDVAWRTTVTRELLSRPIGELWPVRCLIAMVVAYVGAFVTGRVIDNALPGALGTVAALGAASLQYCALLVALDGLTAGDRTRLAVLRRRIPLLSRS